MKLIGEIDNRLRRTFYGLASKLRYPKLVTDSNSECTWSPPSAKIGQYPTSCELEQWEQSESDYCVLHEDSPNKPVSEVNKKLDRLRDQQHSNTAEIHLHDISDGSELDFTDIHFFDANLSNSNFETAEFDNSTFNDTRFRNAKLSKSSYVGAQLNNCDFTGSKLNNADFSTSRTDCSNSKFANTRCNGTKFMCANFSHTDFSGAQITNSHLQGADISSSEFVGATIRNTDAFWTNINSTDFTDAHISGTDFTAVDATEAIFFDAIITDTKFVDSQLLDAKFTGASLTGSVDFGCRIIQEHDADWLAGIGLTRSVCGMPAGPNATDRYGRDAMKKEMGGDWWNPKAEVCETSGDSSVQLYYSKSSILTRLIGKRRRYGVLTWVTRRARKSLSFVLKLIRRVAGTVMYVANQLIEIINSLSGNSSDKGQIEPDTRDSGHSAATKSTNTGSGTEDQFSVEECRNRELSNLEQAEKIYGELEAAYSGTAWARSRRRLNIRQQEVRRKQSRFRRYPFQGMMKWSMCYGESPIHVLGAAFGVALLGATLLLCGGIEINGSLVGYRLSGNWPGKSLVYFVDVLIFSIRKIVGVEAQKVNPTGLDEIISFSLVVAGKLLFAMFVYTLGRRAVS
ncbi:pentapeptide repeat-containing protein [Haloarchaeobius sp. DT45]|uniref:pentapeptide repeat-containing protein n=1 Tax=Haloarchaeobius sp. DT45 TaxID=3446116 RepID=UPI003F6B6EF8